VVNLDKLTYAGNLANLAALAGDARHGFVRGDIADRALVERVLAEHRPRAVVHFAAESHVDRSIHGPGDFIQTNVVGTFALLEAVRTYWGALGAAAQAGFRFLPRVHRRGVRNAGRVRPRVRGDHGVCAQQPVLGVEGGLRPPGARLPTTPTDCPWSPPIARTTTARTSSRRS